MCNFNINQYPASTGSILVTCKTKNKKPHTDLISYIINTAAANNPEREVTLNFLLMLKNIGVFKFNSGLIFSNACIGLSTYCKIKVSLLKSTASNFLTNAMF